jgi:hypothetical protein
VGVHDPSQPLVIDPVLSYATYLGGSMTSGGSQEGNAIAVDSAGNAYVTGATTATDFPTTPGAFEPTLPQGSAGSFVTKLNASGTALVYSTYVLGGVAYGIAVNSAGDAYITGGTSNPNFPTTLGAFQTKYAGFPLGGGNAFVTELNPSGSGLVYSTFLGGSSNDLALGIALDSAGDAYITGRTNSSNFPTTAGAFQTTLAGSLDAFVTKLNPSGSALVYSTFLGGSKTAAADGIALDSAGDAYITGYANSSNFPTTAGAFQTTLAGGVNVFVTKVNAGGTALVYSTYLGGSGNDYGDAIAVDSGGNAYVTGRTNSSNFPTTAGAFQMPLGGGDAFVTKLNASGSGLVYSSDLSGISGVGDAIAVGGAGNVYVTGWTGDPNFPTTADALPYTLTLGSEAVFVTEYNSSGSALVYSTYLGGGNNGYTGYGIAVDSAGNFYVTGQAYSGFPTTAGAFQTTYVATSGNTGEAFVAKFAAGIALVGSPQVNGNTSALAGAQRSMVDSLVYTFNHPVSLAAGAFTIALHPNVTVNGVTGKTVGTLPTLNWSSPDGGVTWVVTFSGSSVVNGSIADGVYDLTLNAAAVSDAQGQTLPANRVDTFFRLYGDTNGDGTVNSTDASQFKTTFLKNVGQTGYLAYLDYNGDGTVNNTDAFQLKKRFLTAYTGFSPTV